jgi:hypothetical protein
LPASVPRKDCKCLDPCQQAHEIVFVARARTPQSTDVVAHALLAHLDLQTLGEEVEQVGLLEERAERQAQPVLGDDADDAERARRQRVGIARARRLLADRPERHQRIELVGQRDGDRDRCARAAVVRAGRLHSDRRSHRPPAAGSFSPSA